MIARGYAEMVVDGRAPGCRYVVLACKRFLKMLDLAQDDANPYRFSDEHAVDYCDAIERMDHVESGMWELTQNHSRVLLEPHQIFAEVAIHGFRWRSDGTRVVRRAYQEEPRKQAKSFRLSGAVVYDLCLSGQTAPQVTIAATNADQTNRVFTPLVRQLKKNDELIEQFGLEITQSTVRNTKNSGEVIKLTAQGQKQDGLNPSLAVMEELHGVKDSVYDVVNSAFGARPNALMRMITTAGYNAGGLAYTVRRDMINVLEGLNDDPTVFAIIYTLDEEDYLSDEGALKVKEVLSDPQLVAKANPMLGVSLDPRSVKAALDEAQRSPERQGEVLRTRFNIWGITGKALVNPSSWGACMDRSLNLADFMGERCWAGVDLGLKDDFTSVVLLFERGQDVVIFAKYWVSELAPIFDDAVEGARAITWAREPRADDGFALNTQPNMPVDPAPIANELIAYGEVFDLQSVIVDNYQAVSLLHALADANLPVMEMSNTERMMTVPTHDLLKRIRGNRIKHDGHPVLTWNVENVHGNEKGNGGIVPKKGPNPMKKIDGFVAAVMANAARMGGGKPLGEGEVPYVSPYDSTDGVILGEGNGPA